LAVEIVVRTKLILITVTFMSAIDMLPRLLMTDGWLAGLCVQCM